MGGGFADQLLALSYLRVAACSFAGLFGSVADWDVCGVSNRLPEGSGCGLQAVAYLPKLLRRDVDALLLGVCALALAFSPLAQSFQLRLHLLDRPGEVCQLGCNARYVFLCGRDRLILGRSAAHSLIATASISISTSSRKSALTSTSVLAGGCSVSIYSSRIARTEAISPTLRRK